MKDLTYQRLEYFTENLFLSEDELKQKGIPPQARAHLMRLRTLYTLWQNAPMLTNKEIVDKNLKMHPGLRLRDAYHDVQIIKVLIGNMEEESKKWKQYVFNQHIWKLYEAAIEKQDLKTAERALSDYAKYNRLDSEDTVPMDYDQIVPHQIEPTTDPSVIGIKPVENLRDRITALEHRFGADVEDAEVVSE